MPDDVVNPLEEFARALTAESRECNPSGWTLVALGGYRVPARMTLCPNGYPDVAVPLEVNAVLWQR